MGFSWTLGGPFQSLTNSVWRSEAVQCQTEMGAKLSPLSGVRSQGVRSQESGVGSHESEDRSPSRTSRTSRTSRIARTSKTGPRGPPGPPGPPGPQDLQDHQKANKFRMMELNEYTAESHQILHADVFCVPDNFSFNRK